MRRRSFLQSIAALGGAAAVAPEVLASKPKGGFTPRTEMTDPAAISKATSTPWSNQILELYPSKNYPLKRILTETKGSSEHKWFEEEPLFKWRWYDSDRNA